MNAVKLLSSEHSISTLCRVLKVNRSTYYKFLAHKPSNRELENREIRKRIIKFHSKSKKRFGTYKMAKCLAREYRINVSVQRVFRLMKGMQLPKMSTVKPFILSTKQPPTMFVQTFWSKNLTGRRRILRDIRLVFEKSDSI